MSDTEKAWNAHKGAAWSGPLRTPRDTFDAGYAAGHRAGRLAALEEAEKAVPKVEWPDRHPDPEAAYHEGFMDGQTRMAWDCQRAIRLLRSSSPEGSN